MRIILGRCGICWCCRGSRGDPQETLWCFRASEVSISASAIVTTIFSYHSHRNCGSALRVSKEASIGYSPLQWRASIQTAWLASRESPFPRLDAQMY